MPASPNITLLGNTTGLLDRIYTVDPDVIIIDLQNPSRDVLEQMFQVSRIVRRPIAMFVDQSDRATIEEAIDAGVSAYIVDGLKQERVRAILDMTISRFRRLRTPARRTGGDQERAQGAQGDREGQGHPDEEPRPGRGGGLRPAAPDGHEQGPAYRRHGREPGKHIRSSRD